MSVINKYPQNSVQVLQDLFFKIAKLCLDTTILHGRELESMLVNTLLIEFDLPNPIISHTQFSCTVTLTGNFYFLYFYGETHFRGKTMNGYSTDFFCRFDHYGHGYIWQLIDAYEKNIFMDRCLPNPDLNWEDELDHKKIKSVE